MEEFFAKFKFKLERLITKNHFSYIYEYIYFFLSGISFADTDNSQTSREREGILLYHFHPLTNMQTFICNFACEMTITYFCRTACIYQIATRWDLPPYRITIWLINDVTLLFSCLHDDLILAFFVTSVWDGKLVDLNSHRLSPWNYKQNWLAKSLIYYSNQIHFTDFDILWKLIINKKIFNSS